MAAKQSVQEVNRTSVPVVPAHPTEAGKERVRYFSYVCATFNQNDTLDLVLIPKGARVVGGSISHDGLAGSTTLAVGTAASATRYKAATAAGASAGNIAFATNPSENIGDLLTADTVLVATLGGANATDAKIVAGWVKTIEP